MVEAEPGEGWADVVSRILRMGTNNPESNQILSKAKKEDHNDNSNGEESDNSGSECDENTKAKEKASQYATVRLKPQAQPDAIQDNELKAIATRGVVHLFNAVKTVNPKSDKRKKKKKKKKKTAKRTGARGFR